MPLLLFALSSPLLGRSQMSHSHQVVRSRSHFRLLPEFPPFDCVAAVQTDDLFQPAEAFFHFFPAALTQVIPFVLHSLRHPATGRVRFFSRTVSTAIGGFTSEMCGTMSVVVRM